MGRQVVRHDQTHNFPVWCNSGDRVSYILWWTIIDFNFSFHVWNVDKEYGLDINFIWKCVCMDVWVLLTCTGSFTMKCDDNALSCSTVVS